MHRYYVRLLIKEEGSPPVELTGFSHGNTTLEASNHMENCFRTIHNTFEGEVEVLECSWNDAGKNLNMSYSILESNSVIFSVEKFFTHVLMD